MLDGGLGCEYMLDVSHLAVFRFSSALFRLFPTSGLFFVASDTQIPVLMYLSRTTRSTKGFRDFPMQSPES